MWDEPTAGPRCQSAALTQSKRVLIGIDSRTVVMEVEIS